MDQSYLFDLLVKLGVFSDRILLTYLADNKIK